MRCVSIALLLVGCTKTESKVVRDAVLLEDGIVIEDHRGEPPKQKTTREGAIAYATLRSREGKAAARYQASLPSDVATAKGDWANAPPHALVASAVCRGDEKLRAQLVAAVARAASKDVTVVHLHEGYDKARGEYCSNPSYCAWVVGLTRSQKGTAREFWWSALEDCRDPATRERFAAPDVPPTALAHWYQPEPNEELDPRYVRALRETVTGAIGSDEERSLRAAVATLATIDDPRAIAVAEELYATPSLDAFLKEGIIAGLQNNPAKVARDFAAAHCGELGPPRCGSGGAPALRRAPFDDLDAWVVEGNDSADLVRRHPARRQDILAALERCATKSESEDHCLHELATLDRARAVAIAKTKSDAAKSAVVDALLVFPRLADLEAELDALGFSTARAIDPVDAPWDFESSLAARGRLTSFDTETGAFPNEHEILLAELAGLIAPDLDGVVFEEVPPEVDANFEKIDADSGYVLVAYMDGRRYEVDAQDLGDWYDLDAVLGMINALARERSAPGRVVALVTGDQTSTVVGGPGPGIVKASEEGFLQTESNLGAGVQSGRDAEDKLFEALERREP